MKENHIALQKAAIQMIKSAMLKKWNEIDRTNEINKIMHITKNFNTPKSHVFEPLIYYSLVEPACRV